MPSIADTLVFFKNNLWIFLWHVWPSPVRDPGQQWLLTSSESITAREWRLLPPSEFLSGTPKLRFLELELLAQSPLTFSVGPQGQAFLQRPESPVRVQGVSSSVHNNSNSKSRLRTGSGASPSDALLLLFSVQGSSLLPHLISEALLHYLYPGLGWDHPHPNLWIYLKSNLREKRGWGGARIEVFIFPFKILGLLMEMVSLRNWH